MIQVGDIRKFNANNRYPGVHFGITSGEEVKILAIHGDPYTYPGCRGVMCQSLDFEVISTGEKIVKASSQWVEDEEFEL